MYKGTHEGCGVVTIVHATASAVQYAASEGTSADLHVLEKILLS